MRNTALAVVAVVLAGCAGSRGPRPVAVSTAVAVEVEAADGALAAASWRGRCEQGFAADCRTLGRVSLAGAGLPADDRLAAAYLMKGCEIGEPASCSDLGVLTLLGRGVAQDDAVGGALTRRACDAGYALACSNLATLAAEGITRTTLRPEEAGPGGATIVRSFQTACDAGAPEGCLNLGTARQRGDLDGKDLAGAARAYQRACEGGLPLACHRWALLAAGAPGLAPEADQPGLERRACRAGILPACQPSGEAAGPTGPKTPTPRLVAEWSSLALGIPGHGGFHPLDLAEPPGGPRRPREELRRLAAGQLASLPAALRERLRLEGSGEGEAGADEPVELLVRLRRAQLATCLERGRTQPAAAELAAFFLVEASGKPGELRVAIEPPDAELEGCAAELIAGWTFPVPAGGVGGPHLVRFTFEAAPPGPAPGYAAPGGLRAALKEPGCLERNLRVPEPWRGAEQSVTVKLVVDLQGRPALFHALTPAPEPLVAAIAAAARACVFTPGVGEDGRPVPLWLTLTVKVERR